MTMITVIGRGHSGTRAMSHTLSQSQVFMGAPLNESGDLLPPQAMYDACRVMAKHVKYLGNLQWDFAKLHTMPIDPEFTRLIEEYLVSVRKSDSVHKGWKIPETTLVFPWIVRMFPEIRYIYWIRDPRDCIIGQHLTDNLADFGIEYDRTDDLRRRRAISWKYQVEIVKATPKPRHWQTVRLEDFVLQQDATLRKLEQFLEIPLTKIPVKPEVIGRWKTDSEQHDFPFFQEDLRAYGYDMSMKTPGTPGTSGSSASKSAPIRKAFVMSVNAGSEVEYERRHRPIWRELEDMLKAHGVRSYSIFLHPETRQLFAYAEIEDEAKWAAIAKTEVCQRWWKHMGDVMPSNADHSPVATGLREVFHIE